MEIEFTGQSRKDIKYWKKINNPEIQIRISELIKDIKEHPFTGIGHPEPLKHQLNGYWSRRINIEHRLVYKVLENSVMIYSLRFHY